MSFQDLIKGAQKYFPNLQIKYKNNSFIMKVFGKILFFNPSFMSDYTTTIDSTIYFPSETFVKTKPIANTVTVLHELVHIHDSQVYNKYIYTLLYLFPQILALFIIPLFFFAWKIAYAPNIISEMLDVLYFSY